MRAHRMHDDGNDDDDDVENDKKDTWNINIQIHQLFHIFNSRNLELLLDVRARAHKR